MYDSFVLLRRKRFYTDSSYTKIFCASVLALSMAGCRQEASGNSQIPVKVLILLKFEIGEMSGDAAGEAQFYYEEYMDGSEEYTVQGLGEDGVLYVKDGVALCVTGERKVSSSVHTAALLADERFDFSDTYVMSVGCAGGSTGYAVMGDVCIITAAADYDLGHHAADLFDTSMKNNFTAGKAIIDAILFKESGF